MLKKMNIISIIAIVILLLPIPVMSEDNGGGSPLDVGLGIFRLQEEQLGDDRVRQFIVDDRAEEDNAIFEQPAVDIEYAFFAAALFDNVGY